jgi:hypothetical protein
MDLLRSWFMVVVFERRAMIGLNEYRSDRSFETPPPRLPHTLASTKPSIQLSKGKLAKRLTIFSIACLPTISLAFCHTIMSSKEALDFEEAETDEEDASITGVNRDEVDDVEETESLNNAQNEGDDNTVKSINDASSQDDEEMDDDEDDDGDASRRDPSDTPKTKPIKSGAHKSSSGKKGRTPSVAGLSIPFRTVKKA